MNDTARTSASPGGTRREFLIAGSAVLAGALLLHGDHVPGPSGLEAFAAAPGERTPVAYVEGSAGATSLDAALAGPRRAVPAHKVRAGDSLAGAGFRASVRGFAGADHGRRTSAYGSVLVDTLLPSPVREAAPIPFYAFTFRRDPAVSISGPARMRVAGARGLRMGLTVAASDSSGASSSTAVFTSGPQRGLPVLRAGIYLLGLRQGMFDRPLTLPPAGDAAWAALPAVVLLVEGDDG